MEAFIIAVGIYPMIVTKGVDFLRNTFDKGGSAPKALWNISAAVIGIAIALIYQLDYAELIPNLPPSLVGAEGVTAQVVTGLGIGALGSFWHEVNDFISSKANG